jgi:hypothetical protein
MEDHDQRFKHLLKAFLPEFIDLFWPAWAAKLDFTQVEWLEQEQFLNPPQGEKISADIVAKVAAKEPIPALRVTESASCLALIHVEVEHPDRIKTFRHRMFDFYCALRRKYNIPVLPLALFLQVSQDGIGWDMYEEVLWDKTVVRFEYAYVGLPALNAEQYLQGANILGVGLASLMSVPKSQQAFLMLEAESKIRKAALDEARRELLLECVETYFPLEGNQEQEYERLRQLPQYREVNEMRVTSKELGRQEMAREILHRLLEKRFGLLSASVQQRVDQLPPERVRDLIPAIMDAPSLRELGLED